MTRQRDQFADFLIVLNAGMAVASAGLAVVFGDWFLVACGAGCGIAAIWLWGRIYDR